MNVVRHMRVSHREEHEGDALAMVSQDPVEDFPQGYPVVLYRLVQKIRNLGGQCLLPHTWQLDFQGIPLNLFCSQTSDPRCASIRSISSDHRSEFRGKIAFEKLLLVGREVRDRMYLNKTIREGSTQLPCEPMIANSIKNFVSWATIDADLEVELMDQCLIIQFSKLSHSGDSADAYARLLAKVKRRAEQLLLEHQPTPHNTGQPLGVQYKAVSSHPNAPVIFVVAICGPRLEILAQSPNNAGNSMYTILTVNYTLPEQDLWNTLCVVLTIMTARDQLVKGQGPSLGQDSWNLETSFNHINIYPDYMEVDV